MTNLDDWKYTIPFFNVDINGCIIRQLFSIICVNPYCSENLQAYMRERSLLPDSPLTSQCAVNKRETQIGLDLTSFAFLMFQLRILNSYLYQWCILDIRCEIIQADRQVFLNLFASIRGKSVCSGAVLVNQLIEKQMLEQKQQQDKVYNDLRKRMVHIRQRYEEEQRKQGAGYFVPVTYAQAKQSGVVEDDPVDDEAELPAEATVAEALLGGRTQDTLITAEVSRLPKSY